MSPPEFDFRKQPLQSPAIPDGQWIEWFCDEFSRQHVGVEASPLGDGRLAIAGVARVLPDLSVYRGTTAMARARVTPSLVTSDDPYLVACFAGGLINYSCNGKETAYAPGSCLLSSQDRVGTLDVLESADTVFIRLRRKLLEPLVPGLSDRLLRPVAPNSEALRLLLNYIQMLDGVEEIADAHLRFAVTAHVHELAALALKSNDGDEPLPEVRGVRAGRLAAIKADIIDHLTDTRLSVSFITARHGITPRYLHMLFAADGVSFTDFVLDHRIARAHRMLTDPLCSHLQISAIALHVGFNELSYFNRVFRRRYDRTPSDIRAAARSKQ